MPYASSIDGFFCNFLDPKLAFHVLAGCLIIIHIDVHMPERAVRRTDPGVISAAFHIAAIV